MRVLVTGGAGFIGSNLARELVAAGHAVVVLDNLATGYRDNLDGVELDFREGDIRDAAAVRSAAKGADAIVHLAALGSVPRSIKDPVTTHDVNATGTLSVLEGARAVDVSRVLYSSSSSVYGRNPALPKHEREWIRPMSPYAVSKLAAEQYVLAYQESFGFDTLAFRFFNVYGPRQRPGHAYAAVIPVFVSALLQGLPLPVDGDGTQSRDFTFVGTVTRTIRAALEGGVSAPEPVNLAFGGSTTLLALIAEIEHALGLTARLEHRPSRRGDVPHSQADPARIKALFPDVDPVDIEQGVRQTASWMKEWLA